MLNKTNSVKELWSQTIISNKPTPFYLLAVNDFIPVCSCSSDELCVSGSRSMAGRYVDCTVAKRLTLIQRPAPRSNVHFVPVCVSDGLVALIDDYKRGSKERKRLLEGRYGRRVMQLPQEETMTREWVTTNTKSCPHCSTKIEVCV